MLVFVLAGTGWEHGAPKDACVDVSPRHSDAMEAMPCPYRLKLEDDTTTYIPGETLIKGRSHCICLFLILKTECINIPFL